MKENILDLLDNQIALVKTKDTLKSVMRYKEDLASFPSEDLTNNQRLWLLGYEASEARVAKMSTEQGTNDYIESLFVLRQAMDAEEFKFK